MHHPSVRMILFAGLIVLCGSVPAAIKPVDLKAAHEGADTYYRMELKLPADAYVFEHQYLLAQHLPLRFPVLVSDPPFASPCYMQLALQNEWAPVSGSNIFYGRTREKELKLKLIYPKRGKGWGEEDVLVKLDGVPELQAESNPLHSSPRQQFARAQAGYLRLLKYQIEDDAGFLSFARLQTLRMAGLSTTDTIADAQRNRSFPNEDLYATATGARAIQESLQMDRVLRPQTTSETRTIAVSGIEGVQTKSHPFDEMMKGLQPVFSSIAEQIPADQYMLRFTSVAKLQELADFAQRWGHSLMESPEVGGADAGLRERLQKQICLPATLLSRLLGPAIVKELAVTGSDPFFREGTDVTVVFDTVSPQLFKAAVDQYWKAGQAANPGAEMAPTTLEGTAVERIVTPERAVSAYRAFLGNTVIYSNSPVALKRILQTRKEKAASLASAPDFRYMRCVWPQDPKSEDGFLYLSDAFIRRLVGPATRIAEKRRIEAYGTMRLVTNAAMFHGFLNGPAPVPTIEQMTANRELSPSDIRNPEGELKWDPSRAVASNTVYGTMRFMTPLCELPVDKITSSEQSEYEMFRNRYQEYWRRYFDPIGIRIKVDKTISLEACILPLIQESHYNDLKELAGTKPATFDLGRISTSTLVRWQLTLNPESHLVRDMRQFAGGHLGKDATLMNWIGNWATIWIDDGPLSTRALRPFLGYPREYESDGPDESSVGKLTSIFDLPLAAGIEVTSRMGLAAFLVSFRAMVESSAPNTVQFTPQEPYKGVTAVKISPVPGGEFDREINGNRKRASAGNTSGTVTGDSATTTPDIGIFYAAIGNAWYITFKKAVLDRLADAQDAISSSSREIEYNALLTVSPQNVRQARPAMAEFFARQTRNGELETLREAWLLYRCGLVAADGLSAAARNWFGGDIALPSGGRITYDGSRDECVSSVLGPMRDPRPASTVAGDNPLLSLADSIANLRAWLRFTEEGLITHIELERR